MNNCPVGVRARKKYLELAKTLAYSFENTYYKCGAGLQTGTSPVVSFSRIFSLH